MSCSARTWLLQSALVVDLLLGHMSVARAASVEWLQPAQAATISADVSQNVMFAQFTVGETPLRFLIDTGASVSVLDSGTTARLGLRTTGSERLQTSGGATGAAHVQDLTVSAPEVRVRGLSFVVTSLAQMARHFGRHVDGILGYDFIALFAVELDFATRRLRLETPSRKAPPGFACLPLEIRGRQPYATATVVGASGAMTAGRFMVDTGASGTLQLEGAITAAPGLAGEGERQDVGHGVGGGFRGLSRRVAAVRVGAYESKNPRITLLPVAPASRGDGLLGGAILRRFTVIIDYPRKAMCLRPNAEYAQPFASDLSGLVPVWEEPGLGRLVIESVSPGSAAARAGLEPGDEIIALDGRAARQIDVDTLGRLMRTPAAHYELRIRRRQHLITVRLSLPTSDATGR